MVVLNIALVIIAVAAVAIVAVCLSIRHIREAFAQYVITRLKTAQTKSTARGNGRARVLIAKADADAAVHRAKAARSEAQATAASATADEIRALVKKSAKDISAGLVEAMVGATKRRDNAAAWLSRSLAALIDVLRGLVVAAVVLGVITLVWFGLYSFDKANTNPRTAVVLVCRGYASSDGGTLTGRVYTSSGTFSINPGVYGGVHYRTSVGAIKAFPARSWVKIDYHGYTGPLSDPFGRWVTSRRLLPRRPGVCR